MTKAFLNRNWPLVPTLLLLWAGLAISLALCLGSSGGHLVYPLDDPYIHMAMAKNFARHGVWGVTRFEFSFSSPSPLWTALVSAAFLVFGTSVWVPLVINAILASLLCVLLYLLLRRAGAGPWLLAAVLPAIVFLTPLIVLAMSGLEHLLHISLAICFVYLVASRLSAKETESRTWWAPAAIGALLVLTRYEGLFMLFIAVGLCAMRKRWTQALMLAAVGLLPISLLGLFAVSHGWGFFPNSILLKGNLPIFSSLPGFLLFCLTWARQLFENPHLLALLALLILIGFARIRRGLFFEDRLTLMIILTVGTLLLHLQFARTGWLFRYEAYLVTLGLFAATCALADPGSSGLTSVNLKRLMVALAAAFGGVFTCNANKAEATVGYTTLYGDLAGYLAALADLWKGEVYALGRYLNEAVFQREVIPAGCFDLTPSAELGPTQAVDQGLGDPLIYPYHDRLFASWVEAWQRTTPEEILEWYLAGTLEQQLGYAGKLADLFPSAREFIADLERWWRQYNGMGVAKRIQAPPVLAIKRRAFGFDHREAQMGVWFSGRYLELKKQALARQG